jgi:hydrogenase nickel incorporation protein HypA/HybF
MHEFSIAQNIIEIVEDTVKQNNLNIVEEVELEIGELSGVEITALETALECLLPGSSLEQTKMHIHVIKGIVRCRKCKHQFTPEDLLTPCPKCNTFSPEIISGKELRVKSISGE